MVDVAATIGICVSGSLLIFSLVSWRMRVARCALLADALQQQAAAFQDYFASKQACPPSGQSAESVPKGMEDRIKKSAWCEPTPVGGHYRWTELPADSRKPGDIIGSLTVTAFSPDPPLGVSSADLTRIDEIIDDGNLSSGSFRRGFNGWPTLLVRARR